jgi:hypothetical protein
MRFAYPPYLYNVSIVFEPFLNGPMRAQRPRGILTEKIEHLRRVQGISSDPAQCFTLEKQIEQAEVDLAKLGGCEGRHGPQIDLSHLPAGAEHFLGRGPELAALDQAWTSGRATSVVELIAPGGTGKTALVKRWLDGLRTGQSQSGSV